MTSGSASPTATRWNLWRNVWRNPVLLWCAFILVHLWLGLVNLYGPGLPLGDVSIVYKFWADQVFIGGFWVGIQSSWVYPILAIFPMLAAAAFGPDQYASTWLSLVLLLDAVGFVAVIGWQRRARNVAAAWWWIGFLLLLGPIASGRIDAITVPLAILGVMVASTRPRLAAAIVTVAAWVKVWPAALIGALVITSRERWRVVLVALGVSAVIVGTALAFGSGSNVFSFITQQTARGLQVESPVSTIWMWQAFAHVPGTIAYYDQALLTWQVTGDGVGIAGILMMPLMMLAVLAVALAGVLALRRGESATVLLPTVSLGLVSALIAFNKVGSPQFISWLAVPVILGLATSGRGKSVWFTAPAILVAMIAALTQAFYPYLYGGLLALNPILLVVLSLRNLLIFVVLGWSIVTLLSPASVRETEPELQGV